MAASQAISIAGAALVLGAFAALQFRRATPHGRYYLLANVLGSGCLALAAVLEGLWAFVTLNSVWGLVSLRSLLVSTGSLRDSAATRGPERDPTAPFR